jgi:hypothetical protein
MAERVDDLPVTIAPERVAKRLRHLRSGVQLRGRRDRHCMADARAAAAAISGGHLLLLSHVGHAWPPYHPKLFASVATGFLSAPDRPG